MNYSFKEEMKNKDADDMNHLVAYYRVGISWNTDEIEKDIGMDFSTLEDNDWWIQWGVLHIDNGDKIYQFRGEQNEGFQEPYLGFQFNGFDLNYAT